MRVIQAIIFVIILLVILVGRFVYLQIINHDVYAALSKENRVKLVAIPPTRGLIFDRNGILLAESQPSYSLEIISERVINMDKTLEDIANLIDVSDIDIARFFKLKKRRSSFQGIPLRLKMTNAEVAKIAVNQHHMLGVDIVVRLIRHYPQKQHAAHVLGYVGHISEQELDQLDKSDYRGTSHIGKSGIERHYEATLHGRVGMQQVEINARGRVLRKLESVTAQPGNNLYLTIDSKLQHVAEQALGEESGAVVAIAPQTGEVLVFASKPGYDPNLFVDGIDYKTYKAYNESGSRPLYNRALHGRYPPGSTIKPFVALAGLETGIVEHDHSVSCPGYYSLPGDNYRYRCWKERGHGTVNMHKSIVESCDVFYYQLARALKINHLHDYMVLFGFGEKTGVDLLDTRNEPSGLFPSRGWKRQTLGETWYPGETLITGIGQGFILSTPLQLASATATLANHGVRIRPRLVRQIEDMRTGEKIRTPIQRFNVVPKIEEEHWEQVIQAMRDVVHSPTGTARRLNRDIPYSIAGKTGTAQVIGIGQDETYDETKIAKKYRDHALFVAFAPVENPQIAVAVIVENGGSGSSSAAPVAGEVIKAWLVPKIESGELVLGPEISSASPP